MKTGQTPRPTDGRTEECERLRTAALRFAAVAVVIAHRALLLPPEAARFEAVSAELSEALGSPNMFLDRSADDKKGESGRKLPHSLGVGSGALLACPFCGGEASDAGHIRFSENHECWWPDGSQVLEAFYCNCMSCSITNQGLVGHQSQAAARANWNTRSPANIADEPRAGT
jgi:hypothetical protein